MPTYHAGSTEISELIEALAAKYHAPLHDAGVTIDVLVALPKDNDGTDLVKLHGRECYATIAVTPFKLRCRGLADATLTVDGPKWDSLSQAERVALIDHELQHLELCVTKGRMAKDGSFVPPSVKRDDLDRPKLRLRPHDWEIGGFDLIVSRHGANSLELQACREMVRGPVKQVLLPFMSDSEPTSSERDAARKVFTNAPGVTKKRAPSRKSGLRNERRCTHDLPQMPRDERQAKGGDA